MVDLKESNEVQGPRRAEIRFLDRAGNPETSGVVETSNTCNVEIRVLEALGQVVVLGA